MTSKPVAFLLADLGVTKTHSRPYVSDDNPYSESQFLTMKYPPDFPDRFGSIHHSRSPSQFFFSWYNDETSAFRYRSSHSGHGPLWSSRRNVPEASGRFRCRLPGALRTLRTLIAKTASPCPDAISHVDMRVYRVLPETTRRAVSNGD
jgi:hypothetical protein